MIAGLPGTGIGGTFYLLSAFLMPFYQLNKMRRRKARRHGWKSVVFQLFLAFSMLVGFWLTGLGLGLLLQKTVISGSSLSHGRANVFQVQPLFISLAVLFFVLAFVHGQSLLSRPRKTPKPVRK